MLINKQKNNLWLNLKQDADSCKHRFMYIKWKARASIVLMETRMDTRIMVAMWLIGCSSILVMHDVYDLEITVAY